MNPVYKDPSIRVEDRVKDLITQMTMEEKIRQLTSIWLTFDPDKGDMAPSPLGGFSGTDPDFNIEDFLGTGIGQITRPFGSQPIDPMKGAEMVNRIQKRLTEETRLGIPAICHEECLTGFMAQGATSFPSPLNFGATWEPELIEKVGSVIRRQMRSVGTHQGLAPVADVCRDSRWGRVEETMGEDPYLVGTMVTRYVKGLQGPDIRHGVIATLKHFAGYSFSEGGRNFAPAHVGRREFVDVFLTPFEMAVKEGGALSVMNAYQEFDGEAPAASRWLLTEILRDAWGFKGFVVADYGAVSFLMHFHNVAANQKQAAAMALMAGLDIELPNPIDFPRGLKEALEDKMITESDIDVAVSRVLAMKFRLGLFEDPYVNTGAIDLDRPKERDLARIIAEKSVILLSNNGILPLNDGVKSVAVIGPNADNMMALFGNYSFENHVVSTHFPEAAEKAVSAVTMLEALQSRLGTGRVKFARGCDVMGEDTSDIAQAAVLAQNTAVAVVVVGDKAGHFRSGTVGEGTDTPDISLPGQQEKLINALIETGTPTVVVLLNGRPFAIPKIKDRAAAVLEAWFPGQEGANVIVDALFGNINPGGKTTLTFSRTAGVQPLFYNHKFLSPGIPRMPETEPVFPFGHGLSYTTFEYQDLVLSPDEVPVDGEVKISCCVRNSGKRTGDEVVQLYIQDTVASITRPVMELKGFRRITLAPDEKKKIIFTLPSDMLAFTGLDYRKVVEPGEIKVMVGSSSGDIRLTGSFTLTGSSRYPDEDRDLFTKVEVISF
jgi:beta-glucosidase-like glycosyl hydrolase